jgi:hypothetical protein
MREDNQTIIEKLSTEIGDVRNETVEIRKENEILVNEVLDRKLQQLREDLSGKNEDNWLKSLRMAQDTVKNEDDPKKKPESGNKLVAMNNKIYKMANEADNEPKPRLQVKK